MLVCVCVGGGGGLKAMGRFSASIELSESKGVKVGVKFAAPLCLGRIL